MKVPVVIDNALRVEREPNWADWSYVEEQIRERLTVSEYDKSGAMLNEIELYRLDRNRQEFVMPRGFAAILRAGLESLGHEVEWIDRTKAPLINLELLSSLKGPVLYPDQERAAQEVLKHRQGILQAGTGAGKTVVGLECWRRAGVRGLVIVDKIGLAEQWVKRAQEHLGITPGFIGSGAWRLGDLTIASVATLYSRPDDGRELLKEVGMVIVDECHHAASMRYQEVLSWVHARYFLGKTATPLEGDWYQDVILHTIGPIFHITTDAELAKTGRRVIPSVKVVPTSFKWEPKTKRDKELRDPRVIYRRIVDALKADRERANQIIERVTDQPQSCAQLIVADDLEYLTCLQAGLVLTNYLPDYRIRLMIGDTKKAEREEIREMADAGGAIILGTSVVKEGMDIPRLDRLHLVWPQKRELTIKQTVGRVMRAHPDKTEAIIFDWADFAQMVLRKQHFERRKVYAEAGYDITVEGMARGTA